MAPAKQPTAGWFQTEILKSLQEVKDGVQESLKLGRSNGEDIRLLRKELGVDGAHGRLPEIERAWARIDRQQETDHRETCALIAANQEKIEKRFEEFGLKQHGVTNRLIDRIELLEKDDHRTEGRAQLWEILRTVIFSSASATAIGILAKMLGWIH